MLTKKNIIIPITIIAVAGFFIYYATAGIFKTNTQVVNDLTSGLVGYWTFDGQDTDWEANTTNDLSGNNNTGTMTNMSTSSSPTIGVIGQALNFDGQDDYVDTVDIDITDQITTSAWINLESFSGGIYPGIVSKTYTTAWLFCMKSTSRDLSVWIDGVQIAFTTGQPINFNEWTHVAFTYDKDAGGTDEIKIFINGNQVATGDYNNPIPTNNNNLEIGRNTSSEFDGQIDEVRIYNRALSASEITELYNQGAKRLIKTNINQKTDVVGSGLVGYWTFDGSDTDWSANTTNDLSGNSNTGTITNMSTSSSPTIGVIGQALNFDYVDDYISQSSSDYEITDTITVSTWFKANSLNNWDSLVGKIDGTNNWNKGYLIYYNNNRLNFFITNYSSYNAYKTFTNDNKWHHVVGIYDGSDIRIYIDNVEGISDFYTGSIDMSSTVDLRIGCSSTSSSNPFYFFDGQMDEVRIYNRALSASEVTELYNQGAEKLLKVNMPQTDLIPNGLVGYWTFDGQDTDWEANTTNDLSGNNNTGTMTNMSTSSSPAIGVIGQALDFDGADDYVDAGSSNLGISGFTYCAWIYPEAITGSHIILHYNNAADNDSLGLRLASNGLMDMFDGNGSFGTSVTPITVNNWYHVCFASDSLTQDAIGDTTNAYINGALDNTKVWSYNPYLDSDHFYISNPIWGNIKFSGFIDEVRVYNRGLSADEIKELYMAGAGR